MAGFSTALPAELAACIASLLENRPRKELWERAERLSQGYRARKPTRDTIQDETDALAYALTRLPATYAAAASVFARLREEAPCFAPKSLLDLGCGTGAASFAALEIFPRIETATLLDRSGAFLTLARSFLAASARPALAGAKILDADLTRLPADDGEPRDLVVLGYALTEIPDADLPKTLDAIWRRVGGVLALIEPGTPRDHARLMAARKRLVTLGANILLPCPHNRPCPIRAPDWCHFSVRLPRSRDHRLAKGADAPFEDEKFSYLIVSKQIKQLEPRPARILAPPLASRGGIELKLCETNGISLFAVAKRDKARYDKVRKCVWGDSVDGPGEDIE